MCRRARWGQRRKLRRAPSHQIPYGYSSASLPIFITLPNTQRILGALPRRGDIVVFRWPGTARRLGSSASLVPGDRIAMKNGRLWINGTPVGLQADGMGFAEDETGARQPVSRFTETLPSGRQHTIFKEQVFGMLDNMAEITVPPNRLFVMGDNRDDSSYSRVPVDVGGVGLLPVSDLVGRSTHWSAPGTWPPPKAGRSGTGRPDLRLSRFFSAVH